MDSNGTLYLHVDQAVAAGKAVIVAFTTTDADAFPYTAADSEGNIYGLDVKAFANGVRTAQLAAIGIPHALAVDDTISVAHGGINLSAGRAAVAMAFDGIRGATVAGLPTPGAQNGASIDGGINGCVSGGNNSSSHPSSGTFPSTATQRRLVIGAAGVTTASLSAVGFCPGGATPIPGGGGQVCVGSSFSPAYQYPTPTPNPATGAYVMAQAGTTTSATNRQVDAEWRITTSAPDTAALDGNLFVLGSTTPSSKGWAFVACPYIGAVQP